MRVGIVCFPTYGGSGIVATDLGRALAKRGHDVHFFSYSSLPRLTEFQANLWYHPVGMYDYPLFPHPYYTLNLASKVIEVVSQYELELLHVHYAIPHAISAVLARDIIGNDKLKVITTLHGTDITLVGRDPSFFPMTKYGVERSDGITVVSRYLEEETRREFSIERPIEVIYNAVDTEDFSPAVCEKEHGEVARLKDGRDFLLLHVSNFRPVKRVGDVVRVFERIRRDVSCKLILFGEGPEMPGVRKQVHEMGLEEDVVFLHRQETLPSLYACSDLFLLPSEYESFGLAALESMSCGTPVVASRAGGLPEVITHEKDGFLAPVGDVDAMAEFGVGLLQDGERLRQMGKNARKTAVERFNIVDTVQRYEDYYAKVLGNDAGGSE